MKCAVWKESTPRKGLSASGDGGDSGADGANRGDGAHGADDASHGDDAHDDGDSRDDDGGDTAPGSSGLHRLLARMRQRPDC